MQIISKILIIVLIPSALSLVILFSGINREILAKNKTSVNIQTSVNSNDKFEYEDENEDEDESVSINTKSNASTKNSVKIENNKFEIEGAVDSLSANSFTVSGQSISIDTALVNTYRQKGILKVGNQVKVKGTIKNSILYAEDVKVMPVRPSGGEGALGNFGPTPTDSATVSTNANVKIKANGPVGQVILFLNQILSFLKSLV